MKLDVGCGSNPKGNVNVDLYPASSEHRRGAAMSPHDISNFVQASAFYLPFRDSAFSMVYCGGCSSLNSLANIL